MSPYAAGGGLGGCGSAVMAGAHKVVHGGLAELHLAWAGSGGVPRLHDPEGPAVRWRDGWAVQLAEDDRSPAAR